MVTACDGCFGSPRLREAVPLPAWAAASHAGGGGSGRPMGLAKGALQIEDRANGDARHRLIARAAGNTDGMVDDTARDRAIYHALKAADEVAAALQTHLIEEHGADPDRGAAQSPSTNSLKLLRQARERLGQGLRAVEADHIAESDKISLRNQ